MHDSFVPDIDGHSPVQIPHRDLHGAPPVTPCVVQDDADDLGDGSTRNAHIEA
ncbi:hypothetical protein ACGFT2_06155 [Streptomyces sp. NPDC048514]|uniref:hypothetical protein n=1 Tax=Streptomyces sp. NPDC048514 TaxID=3365564 RepID=UPI003720DBB7